MPFSARCSGTSPSAVSRAVTAHPIVYEDFLPKSAAGIFASNLTSEGAVDAAQRATARDAAWLQDALGRTLHDPYELYAAQV